MIKNKKITKLLFLLLLIVIGEITVLFLSSKNLFTRNVEKNHFISLTENGFVPFVLTVAKEDKVTFSTLGNKYFWPASDFHPTHEIYSEFDSRRPVGTSEQWAFTFEKEGTWGFHDHLNPLFKGKIIVQKRSKQAKTNNQDQLPCQKADVSCWGEQLEQTIKHQGLAQAFDLFTKLFTSEPVFAENCHGYTHRLGEEAYEQFSKNKEFPVTPQVAYCSYGFFHGFIEAMMQKTGNLNQAEEICKYIDQKLAGQTDTLGACYHGIGHGVTDASDPRGWGDVFAIINPGLELCEQVGDNEYDVKLCGTGVFNALASIYLDPKYKLNLNRDDPFWICRQQTKSYFKHACYDDFKTLIMSLTKNDFLKAARYIEQVAEDEYAKDAMDNLATYYVYYLLKDTDYSDGINKCHSLQERLRVACIRGLGAGFMTAGIPDREYIRALEICKSPLITEDERDGCYGRVVRLIALRYSPQKYKAICQTIDEKYQKYCQ